MALDRARMGNLVAEQMDALEADYPEDTDAEIYSAISVVEIVKTDGEQRTRAVRIRFTTEGDMMRLASVLKAAELQIFGGLGMTSEGGGGTSED
jgi:hypothetical protein